MKIFIFSDHINVKRGTALLLTIIKRIYAKKEGKHIEKETRLMKYRQCQISSEVQNNEMIYIYREVQNMWLSVTLNEFNNIGAS